MDIYYYIIEQHASSISYPICGNILRRYKFKTKGILKNARDAVRLKRLDAGELEWKRQIAACTIQLAWRKFARRKLLDKLKRTGSRVIHSWDNDMLSLKQNYVLQNIYCE